MELNRHHGACKNQAVSDKNLVEQIKTTLLRITTDQPGSNGDNTTATASNASRFRTVLMLSVNYMIDLLS